MQMRWLCGIEILVIGRKAVAGAADASEHTHLRTLIIFPPHLLHGVFWGTGTYFRPCLLRKAILN